MKTKIRKMLVSNVEKKLDKTDFLCFSQDRGKYEDMESDGSDAEVAAGVLIPGESGVIVTSNDAPFIFFVQNLKSDERIGKEL